MNTTLTIKYNPVEFSFRDAKFYLWSFAFVAGNILLPQLCHFIADGGKMLLPIYFFTLIGAYRFGWRVGLATAILSPLINSLLFSMPVAAMLPVIMVKSLLLAGSAFIVSVCFKKLSFWHLGLVILAYQGIGFFFEWLYSGSLTAAWSDITLGWPGILLQIVGGYFVLRQITKVS